MKAPGGQGLCFAFYHIPTAWQVTNTNDYFLGEQMNEQAVRILDTEGQNVGDLGPCYESSSYMLGGAKCQGIPEVRGGQYGGQSP